MKSRRNESFGFVRVGTATPIVKVANCTFNAQETAKVMKRASRKGVQVLFFPELGITSYTCADLFQQAPLLDGAIEALEIVLKASEREFSGLTFVGMPIEVDDQLFNCAVALSRGKILGVVPKSCIPNYKEFYEDRWFQPAANARSTEIKLLGQTVPFGADLLFEAEDFKGLVVGAEICEDLWMPIPPSSFLALHGATVIGNLSASNELIGKADYRRDLVKNQSARCIAAYAYTSAGVHESTTDVVFGGHQLIAESNKVLVDGGRFERESTLNFTDIDLDRIRIDRLRTNSFGDSTTHLQLAKPYRRVTFKVAKPAKRFRLSREIEAHPFVPRDLRKLEARCEEIFNIQIAGLAKRLEKIGNYDITIGVSGGLDSTLALLVACKTMDKLGVSRKHIKGFTMPGFGTTDRTLQNAIGLMEELGITVMDVADIRGACLEEMRLMGHKPFGIDIDALYKEVQGDEPTSLDELQNTVVEKFTEMLKELPEGSQDLKFENTQARMRTSVLMNSGFVLGTGDLSELFTGWCTFNGDHMSMYNVNASVPKTLVKFLVRWVAENQFEGRARELMLDIVATEISPELLPAGKDGRITQKTESSIGPYELIDFFMYHILRYGTHPEKILFVSLHADFDTVYTLKELRKWLAVSIKRFFQNQFKRSSMPDGPKVGSLSVSPRGDLRMPSDGDSTLWLTWADSVLTDTNGSGSTDRDSPVIPPVRVKRKRKDKVFRVLLRVDYGQNDFRPPNGALAVDGGDEIVDNANDLANNGDYDFRVDSYDDHCEDHRSFAEQHQGKSPFEEIILNGLKQTLWPVHCVNRTYGWRFHPDCDQRNVDLMVGKGKNREVDSYSAFYDNGKDAAQELKERYPFLGQSTGLAERIVAEAEAAGCDEIQVDVCGLAIGFCTSWSALHARAEKYKGKQFKVRLIEDASRALEIKAGDYKRYIDELKAAGIEIVQTKQVLATSK